MYRKHNSERTARPSFSSAIVKPITLQTDKRLSAFKRQAYQLTRCLIFSVLLLVFGWASLFTLPFSVSPQTTPPPAAYLGPAGANALAAQTAPYWLTGDDIRIGIIEYPNTGTGIPSSNNLGSRLITDRNFNFAPPFESMVPPAYVPLVGLPPPSDCVGFIPTEITGGSSEHARLVADVAAGNNVGTYSGIAPMADVYNANLEPGTEFSSIHNSTRTAMDWTKGYASGIAPTYNLNLFNLSFGHPGNDNGNNQLTRFLDWFAFTRKSLLVVAAGNDAVAIRKPGDCYNCITVGATDATFQRRLAVSGYALSSSTRSKPDILAPGENISDGFIPSTGTSFAAPQVTGTAALLAQNGLLPGSILFPRAAKAIILNSARKRFITGENIANAISKDNASTAIQEADYDYLDGANLRTGGSSSGPKTENWTPAIWSKTASGPFIATAPLDDEQGVGVLDVTRAVVQMNGPGFTGLRPPGPVPPISWSLSSVSDVPGEQVKEYSLNFPVTKDSFVTATLVWERMVNETDPGSPPPPPGITCPPETQLGQVDLGDTYSDLPPPNPSLSQINLRIYRSTPTGPVLIASSQSTVDNLQHLHIPVPADGAPNEYVIRVEHVSGPGAQFGLAWWVRSATADTSDFDGDGKADFAVWRPETGEWFVVYSSTNSYSVTQWGASGDVLVPGDYDGDDKTDMAVWRPSDGIWYIKKSSGGNIYQTWGLSTDVPAPGDYDGDGYTDIAAFRPGNGTWYILKSRGGFIFQPWGFNTDKLAQGRYDNDFKTDIAVFRPSEGNWYALLSDGGTAVSAFGASTDKPAMEDYDGDNKTDLTVFRPSISTWFILRSLTGIASTQPWGISTDKLTPADYDGDGKADIAVYRDGVWYVLRSGSNTLGVGFLGTSSDAPVPSAYIPN
jgi:hypothetical protein